MIRQLVSVLFVGSVLCAGIVFNVNAEDYSGKTTLENLQAAFNGESNANARYEAFAAKANEEGYKSVAALFRAAAKSEGIHARKHSSVIKKMGAEPKSEVAKPDVKSTKENLEAALKGESEEKDNMYPAFIKQAENDKDSGAVRTFKGAMAAEVEHAKFYKQALSELDSWKNPGKEFLVCLECGYTTADAQIKKCPVCAAPRSKFEVFK